MISSGLVLNLSAERKMTLEFREKRLADANAFAGVSAAAKERPSSGRALLIRLGFQSSPKRTELLQRIKIWECIDGSAVVGHCSGDRVTGEVFSLGVLGGLSGQGDWAKTSIACGDMAASGRHRESLGCRSFGPFFKSIWFLSGFGMAGN
jgi:hypothetical protein